MCSGPIPDVPVRRTYYRERRAAGGQLAHHRTHDAAVVFHGSRRERGGPMQHKRAHRWLGRVGQHVWHQAHPDPVEHCVVAGRD